MKEREARVQKSFRSMLTNDLVMAAEPDSEIGAIAEALRAKVDEIDRLVVAQTMSRNAAWLGPVRIRLDTLRAAEMLPLSRLARRAFAGDSAMVAALSVPHKRAPTDEITAAADRMLDKLRPHEAFLRESRIDIGRLDRIAAGIREIRDAIPPANAKIADRAVPTRRIAELLRLARRDADVLSILVRTKLKDGVDEVVWKSQSRVGKRTGRPRAKRVRPPTD